MGIDAAASEFYKDGGYVLNAEANPEKSPEEIVGKNDEMLWGVESAKLIRDNDRKVIKTREPVNIEEEVHFKGKAIDPLKLIKE